MAARSTRTAQLGTRALSAGIAVALACGPLALVLDRLGSDPPPVAQAAAGVDQRTLSRRAVASETAVAWVTAWLTTPRTRAAELTGFAGSLELPDAANTVTAARVVDAVASAPGVWSVTVTASVKPPKGSARQRFYQVPVAVDGGPGAVRAAPMAIPAVVAGPPPLTDADTGSYPVSVSSDSTLGRSVSAFLTAMLTGQGELTRYTSPGVALRPVTDPYPGLSVRSIQADRRAAGLADTTVAVDGAAVRVQAVVLLPEKGAKPGTGLTASFPLSLRARGGRWEVAAIDPSLQTTGAEPPAGGVTSTPSPTPSPGAPS